MIATDHPEGRAIDPDDLSPPHIVKNPIGERIVPVDDITLLTVDDIAAMFDLPREVATLLTDHTLIADEQIAEITGRELATVRDWRRIRNDDIAAGRDPETNSNALIAEEPVPSGQTKLYKRGKILLWAMLTLRLKRDGVTPIRHGGFGRHVKDPREE